MVKTKPLHIWDSARSSNVPGSPHCTRDSWWINLQLPQPEQVPELSWRHVAPAAPHNPVLCAGWEWGWLRACPQTWSTLREIRVSQRVVSLDTQLLTLIMHKMEPLKLLLSKNDQENIDLYVISSSVTQMVLGLSWLKTHNYHVNWGMWFVIWALSHHWHAQCAQLVAQMPGLPPYRNRSVYSTCPKTTTTSRMFLVNTRFPPSPSSLPIQLSHRPSSRFTSLDQTAVELQQTEEGCNGEIYYRVLGQWMYLVFFSGGYRFFVQIKDKPQYIEDILCSPASPGSMSNVSGRYTSRCWKYRQVFKAQNYEFIDTRRTFLGCVIEKAQLCPGLTKVKAVAN